MSAFAQDDKDAASGIGRAPGQYLGVAPNTSSTDGIASGFRMKM
jgi:hypothetical protein